MKRFQKNSINISVVSGHTLRARPDRTNYCDQEVTIADAVFLVNYIFRSGPAPQICDY